MGLLLDLFIATYTPYPSLLFLNVLNYQNFYYLLFIGGTIDFVLANTYGVVSVLLIILWIINRYIKNYFLKNFFNFFLTLLILKIPLRWESIFFQLIFIYLMKKTYN
ncbi:MAG: hypothetical protein E7164_01680 [Firmicutes bacterium]|nr:hypothetical protein [Bacillota bacterium]